MGVKMGWIQMGHPLARNGAALAPFRANGAHPSFSNAEKFRRLYSHYGSCMPSSPKEYISPC